MMIQLNPPIPVETPRGKAQAMFVIDYSAEHDLYWTCFLDESGESWTFSNKDVRAQANLTLGRAAPKPGARHLKLVNATEVAVVPLRPMVRGNSVSDGLSDDPGPSIA